MPAFPVLIEPGKLVLFEIKSDFDLTTVIAKNLPLGGETTVGIEANAIAASGIRLSLIDYDVVKIESESDGRRSEELDTKVRPFTKQPTNGGFRMWYRPAAKPASTP